MTEADQGSARYPRFFAHTASWIFRPSREQWHDELFIRQIARGMQSQRFSAMLQGVDGAALYEEAELEDTAGEASFIELSVGGEPR